MDHKRDSNLVQVYIIQTMLADTIEGKIKSIYLRT